VLTKMGGRSTRPSFDACRVVVMRNANVSFDMTYTSAEYLRGVITFLGAHRIMIGSDLKAF
jgi:hypothetical protein